MNNPIIDEIRRARADLAEEHGYDLVRLNEWAQKQTEARRRKAALPSAEKPPVLTTETPSSSEPSVIGTLPPFSA